MISLSRSACSKNVLIPASRFSATLSAHFLHFQWLLNWNLLASSTKSQNNLHIFQLLVRVKTFIHKVWKCNMIDKMQKEVKLIREMIKFFHSIFSFSGGSAPPPSQPLQILKIYPRQPNSLALSETL